LNGALPLPDGPAAGLEPVRRENIPPSCAFNVKGIEGQRPTGNQGDLLRHAQEPTYSFVILTFVLILIDTALAFISVKYIPASAGGVSLFFIAVVSEVLFALWFGLYGVIAAYVGTLVGSGLLATESLSRHPEIAVIWAVAGLLQALIPLVATRLLDVDLSMKNTRDWTIIILFAVLVNNIAGAAWGAFTLALVPGSAVNVASVFVTWLFGNIFVTILIVPLALRSGTEKVRHSKLFVTKYWD
jgi:integral membrane sensor domain MASE1